MKDKNLASQQSAGFCVLKGAGSCKAMRAFRRCNPGRNGRMAEGSSAYRCHRMMIMGAKFIKGKGV